MALKFDALSRRILINSQLINENINSQFKKRIDIFCSTSVRSSALQNSSNEIF